MKYEVTYVNETRDNFRHFGSRRKKQQCNHIEMTRYQTDDLETCMALAKDILDVPLAELTLDQVKKDFSCAECIDSMTEQKFMSIRDFYNGRLALWNRMQTDINEQSILEQAQFRYEIPEKYNSFCSDGDSKQIQSYIEVKTVCPSHDKQIH